MDEESNLPVTEKMKSVICTNCTQNQLIQLNLASAKSALINIITIIHECVFVCVCILLNQT